MGVAGTEGFHWKVTPSLTKAGILPSCGMEDRPVSLFSLFPTLSNLGSSGAVSCSVKRGGCPCFRPGAAEAEAHAVDSHAGSKGPGQEHGHGLSLAHALFPRVETRCLFQQLPWRTHPLRWGPLGRAATRPRWPEGASGAGARMDKKGEPDSVTGVHCQPCQGRCVPGTPAPGPCVLCPGQSSDHL